MDRQGRFSIWTFPARIVAIADLVICGYCFLHTFLKGFTAPMAVMSRAEINSELLSTFALSDALATCSAFFLFGFAISIILFNSTTQNRNLKEALQGARLWQLSNFIAIFLLLLTQYLSKIMTNLMEEETKLRVSAVLGCRLVFMVIVHLFIGDLADAIRRNPHWAEEEE